MMSMAKKNAQIFKRKNLLLDMLWELGQGHFVNMDFFLGVSSVDLQREWRAIFNSWVCRVLFVSVGW